MKIKILLYGAFMMLLSISMEAQTLSPTAISSTGGFFSVGGNSLSVTVAEMTMVQTFAQPSNILTQGFQQAEPLTTYIKENDVASGEVVIYPNPTNGQLNINYESSADATSLIKIYNMVGQEVFSQSFEAISGVNTIQFDIGLYRQGIYLLELSTVSSNGKKITSIHKINLVY